MQDLIDQLGLRHDLRNIRHRRNGSDLLHEVTSCLAILLSGKVSKLNPVHQGIESQCLGIVLLRCNERRQLLPHEQRILIGQGVIAV